VYEAYFLFYLNVHPVLQALCNPAYIMLVIFVFHSHLFTLCLLHLFVGAVEEGRAQSIHRHPLTFSPEFDQRHFPQFGTQSL